MNLIYKSVIGALTSGISMGKFLIRTFGVVLVFTALLGINTLFIANILYETGYILMTF